MDEKDLPTKRQHFVPQVYLRGFSPEYEPLEKSKVPYEKYTVFSYDIEKRAYDSAEAVPIPSICYKKKLYEIYGPDGKIIFPNWLEKWFGVLEKKYGTYRTTLEKKVQKENIGISNFLTTKERNFWSTYIAIHLLRNAYLLSEAEKVIKDLSYIGASDKEIKSLVRKLCLPFFQEIKADSEDTKLLEQVLTPMYKMHFAVGVDFDNRLITSDKGASIISEKYPTDEYDEVVFPITSSLCLFLVGNERKDMYRDNSLFVLSEDGKKHITTNVVLDAYQRIYSNHRYSVEEKKFIKDVSLGRNKKNDCVFM